MKIHSCDELYAQQRVDFLNILSLAHDVLRHVFALVDSPAHNDESRAELTATVCLRAPREMAEVTLLLAAGDHEAARAALRSLFETFQAIDPALFIGAVDKTTLMGDWLRTGCAVATARGNARRADVRTSRHAHYEFHHQYPTACQLPRADPITPGAAVDGGPAAHKDLAEARTRLAKHLASAEAQPIPESPSTGPAAPPSP